MGTFVKSECFPNNLFTVKLFLPGFLMYRPSWIRSYSKIGQFFSLGPRPILYFNCICSWLVNILEVSFWPTSISNIYEVYRCYIYIFTKPHPVELSFSGQLPSLTFAWRPSLILITWRLQRLLLCACCFSPLCLHLLLFCQLVISTFKVTHLKSGKTQCNFWSINCFLLKKGLKYLVLLSVSGIRPSDWAPTHCCSESAVGKAEPPGGLTCQKTKCQTSCGLKCSFGGSVIFLSIRLNTRCVCVSGELRYK